VTESDKPTHEVKTNLLCRGTCSFKSTAQRKFCDRLGASGNRDISSPHISTSRHCT